MFGCVFLLFCFFFSPEFSHSVDSAVDFLTQLSLTDYMNLLTGTEINQPQHHFFIPFWVFSLAAIGDDVGVENETFIKSKKSDMDAKNESLYC